MKSSRILFCILALFSLSLPACNQAEEHEENAQRIVVTSPDEKNVISTQQYVCQIHSRRHIEVRALEGGYLEEIQVKEGQAVKQGDLLFKIVPILYGAKLDSELAEAQRAQIEFDNTEKLVKTGAVSDQELALVKARLAKANAQVKLAKAELNFTEIKAPFDGIIDRLRHQHGSLIAEGDILTTLSDNSTMWVYFNVPEAEYLEYMADVKKYQDYKQGGDLAENPRELHIELLLANGNKFPQLGKIGAIEADFNNENGNIAFRADFPNPDGMLRHGQTGNVLIQRTLKNATVIPQRATFEVLDKRYVFVVGEDNVAHQREIVVQNELDDIFVIKSGLDANNKFVLEGVREIKDGEKIEYEFRKPEAALANLKFHAE